MSESYHLLCVVCSESFWVGQGRNKQVHVYADQSEALGRFLSKHLAGDTDHALLVVDGEALSRLDGVKEFDPGE